MSDESECHSRRALVSYAARVRLPELLAFVSDVDHHVATRVLAHRGSQVHTDEPEHELGLCRRQRLNGKSAQQHEPASVEQLGSHVFQQCRQRRQTRVLDTDVAQVQAVPIELVHQGDQLGHLGCVKRDLPVVSIRELRPGPRGRAAGYRNSPHTSFMLTRWKP